MNLRQEDEMYVRDPLRVVVTGPLAAYAAGFCAELERQGYAPQPASELAQLMAHVSRSLDGQGLMPKELTEEVAGRWSWRNGAGSTASSGPGAGSGPC